jgi:hypothetical protein
MTTAVPPLDTLPLGAVFLLIVSLLLLMTEIGFQTGRAWQHRVPEKDTAIGPMTAAMLGLVGFLLAFMVSFAADRYETRRTLILEEANAIGTAYLRAGYLPEPIGHDSRDLLQEYIDLRLVIAQPEHLEAAFARSEAIQGALWTKAEALVAETGGSDVYALYLESLNDLVELHSQREIAAFYARVPPTLLLALIVFASLGMLVLGFNNSYDGRRSVFALAALILVFGSVIYLIIDLDRPREGLFKVSDQPLAIVEERIDRRAGSEP